MTIGRAFIVNPSWWFDWLLIQKAKECIKNNGFFFCEFTFKCRVEREVTSVEMGETVPHGCV